MDMLSKEQLLLDNNRYTINGLEKICANFEKSLNNPNDLAGQEDCNHLFTRIVILQDLIKVLETYVNANNKNKSISSYFQEQELYISDYDCQFFNSIINIIFKEKSDLTCGLKLLGLVNDISQLEKDNEEIDSVLDFDSLITTIKAYQADTLRTRVKLYRKLGLNFLVMGTVGYILVPDISYLAYLHKCFFGAMTFGGGFFAYSYILPSFAELDEIFVENDIILRLMQNLSSSIGAGMEFTNKSLKLLASSLKRSLTSKENDNANKTADKLQESATLLFHSSEITREENLLEENTDQKENPPVFMPLFSNLSDDMQFAKIKQIANDGYTQILNTVKNKIN